MLGPWCCLGILSVMEGRWEIATALAWTIQSSRVSWQRRVQATESSTGKALKKVVNVCRLKPYYSTKGPVFHFSDSSVFQTCSSSDETCSPIAVGCYRKKRIAISSSDDGCIQSSHDSQVKLESDRMVGHGACVVSTDAGGIDDTICQISSVPVCQSVGDIVVSQQYSAPMSGVTKHLGQGSISDEVNKCHSTLCTGDIGFVDNELQ